MDPFSIGFVLSVANTVYSSEWTKNLTQGVLGNILDRVLLNTHKKAISILKSQKEETSGNHDLLKALRKSMIESTDEIRLEMKNQKIDTAFRKRLSKWKKEQISNLNNLDSWHKWNNPAIKNLELFFDQANRFESRKSELIATMTEGWIEYLNTQTSLLPFPQRFLTILKDGWNDGDSNITWWELVMVNFNVYIRSEDNPNAKLAEKALVHNFLSELKTELNKVGENIEEMKPQLLELWEELKSGHPKLTNIIDEKWEELIAPLILINKQQSETINTQNESIKNHQIHTQRTLEKSLEELQKIERQRAKLSIEIRATEEKNDRLVEEFSVLTDRMNFYRERIHEIYALYPAKYQKELAEEEETKSLEQLSIEADKQQILRNELENKEKERNADIKFQLASNQIKTFRFTESIDNLLKAIDLAPKNILFKRELSYSYLLLGSYTEAEKTLGPLLVKDDNDPSNFEFQKESWNRMGNIQQDLASGNYINERITKSIYCYNEALNYHKKIKGDSNYSGAEHILNNLGTALIKAKEYEKAEKYILLSLEEAKDAFGEFTKEVANVYNSLGDLYCNWGLALNDKEKIKISLSYFEKALEIFNKKSLDNDIGLPTIYDNLSMSSRFLGKVTESIFYAKRSLNLRLSIFGNKNLNTAMSYIKVARAYKADNSKKYAIENYKKAVEIFEWRDTNQPEFSQEKLNGILNTSMEIADYLRDLEIDSEAIPWLEKIKAIYQEFHGINSIPVVSINDAIGNCLLHSADYEQAKNMWLDAISICKRYNGYENDIAIFEDNIRVAEELIEKKNNEE